MTATDPDYLPHEFWQDILDPGSLEMQPAAGHRSFFPVCLPDRRQLALPIRQLADGKSGLASLIVNQASFEVVDALCEHLAKRVAALKPDIIAGLPTLGLTLAAVLAQKLGHKRYVPLSTSRKFWYLEELSVPMRSVTSPDQEKRLYIDPRMLPLMQDRRVLLVDDVVSSGTSIIAGLGALKIAGIVPVGIGAAMLQTRRWEAALEAEETGLSKRVIGVFATPRLIKSAAGTWFEDN
jgi:adenine/guanine phosphoribosyltransferase-like PRPP-binding protein